MENFLRVAKNIKKIPVAISIVLFTMIVAIIIFNFEQPEFFDLDNNYTYKNRFIHQYVKKIKNLNSQAKNKIALLQKYLQNKVDLAEISFLYNEKQFYTLLELLYKYDNLLGETKIKTVSQFFGK